MPKLTPSLKSWALLLVAGVEKTEKFFNYWLLILENFLEVLWLIRVIAKKFLLLPFERKKIQKNYKPDGMTRKTLCVLAMIEGKSES